MARIRVEPYDIDNTNINLHSNQPERCLRVKFPENEDVKCSNRKIIYIEVIFNTKDMLSSTEDLQKFSSYLRLRFLSENKLYEPINEKTKIGVNNLTVLFSFTDGTNRNNEKFLDLYHIAPNMQESIFVKNQSVFIKTVVFYIIEDYL